MPIPSLPIAILPTPPLRKAPRLLAIAALVGALAIPLQAGAQWTSPGCMLANLFGMGSVSGGLGFSTRGRGQAFGSPFYGPVHGYGYGPGQRVPYGASYASPPGGGLHAAPRISYPPLPSAANPWTYQGQ